MNKEQKNIIDSIRAWIFYKDKENRFIQVNQAFSEIMGLSKKELEGKSLYDIYPKEEADAFWKDDLEVIESRVAKLDIIEPMTKKNGETIWVKTDKIPYKDSQGNIIGVIGFTIDFTERKKIEETLENSLNRYKSLIELTGQIGWSAPPDGLVEDMPSWRAYTGQSLDEVKGWGWLNAIHPEDIARTKEIWEKCVETKSLYDTEYRIRRKDGVYRYFIARGVPLLDHNGNIREWNGTCIDITERKETEDKLKQTKERIELLYRIIPSAVFTVDQNKRITSWNKKACELTGYSDEEMIGKECALFALEPCNDSCGLYNPDIPKPLTKECTIRTKAGKVRIISKNVDYIYDSQDAIIGGIESFGDITEQKQTEQLLKKAHDDLEVKIEQRTAELAQSEIRLRMATEGANIGTWHWNIETGELLWTNKAKEIFGVPQDEIMSHQRFLDALHPDDREKTDKAVEQALDHHEDYNIDYRAVWQDGSIHWINAKGRGYYNEDGKAIRMEGIVMDITDQKIAEQKLREGYETLERFRKATINREFRIKELSDEVERLKSEKK